MWPPLVHFFADRAVDNNSLTQRALPAVYALESFDLA